MARLARVVAPGLPHHVTQRGNRRQTVFFSDEKSGDTIPEKSGDTIPIS